MDPTDGQDRPPEQPQEPPPEQPSQPADARPPAPSEGVEAPRPTEGVEAPRPTEGLPFSPPPRTGARALILAGIVIVALAAGAAAFFLRKSGGPALETVAPADALAFVKVSLSPSGEQRAALDRLLARFPEEARDPARREQLLDRAFAGLGLDFGDDVKPWIGAEIAAVALAQETGPPAVVGMFAVRDEGAAERSFRKLVFGERSDLIFEVSGGVAYLSDTSEHIDAVQAAAERGALGDNADYRRSLEEVGGEGLAVVWVNGPRLAELAEQGITGRLGIVPGGASQSTAVTLRAEDVGFVLAGTHAVTAETARRGGTPALLESTSDGLLGSLTFFDLGAAIEQILETFAGAGGAGELGFDPTEIARGFLQEALGLDLEKDILPWLHGELSVVVGGFGAGPIPDIGAVIEPTDDAALDRTLTALRERLGALGVAVETEPDGFTVQLEGFVELVVRRGPGRVVIAGSSRYADELIGSSQQALADDAVYRRAFGPTSEGVAFQLFVRIDRIRAIAEGFAPPEERAAYEANIAPWLRPLESLAIRDTISGDRGTFRAILTVAGE